jgi:predicted methyltransferase
MFRITAQQMFVVTTVCLINLSLSDIAFAERSVEDQARDAQRRPQEVLAFLGVQSGDTVLDVWASGGWYTEVLSVAVGPEGRVISQNSSAVLQMGDGFLDQALTARLADGRLANVERLDSAVVDSRLEAESVDFVMAALIFHDIYNGPGAEPAVDILKALYSALKPDGVLGLIDHVGNADADNSSIHRIDPALARQSAVDAGFVIEAESDLLAHPDDDHSKMVFDPSLRGETDRFVLRLRKPE